MLIIYLPVLELHRGLLVASRGYFSGRSPCQSGPPKFPFPKSFCLQNRTMVFCADRKCKVQWESRDFRRGNVMHSHDAEDEACSNRQILNNSVKRKAMEDLCERPRKLIHEELRSQYLDTLTYKDIRNISTNMYKERSSQLLPLQTYTEETHETLSAVQVWRSSTELACEWLAKNYLMFSCNNNLQF
jgi:hypothetical protein